MTTRRVIGMVALAVTAAACGYASPDAGQEAVLIDKPAFFGSGGIQPQPVKTGSSFIWATTDTVLVNMLPQTISIQLDDLMTRDGVPLDFSSSLQYRITDSVKMVTTIGADDAWFARNLEQPYRSAVRDSVKRRGMNEMALDSSAAEAVDKEVTEFLKKLVTERAIPVELRDVTLGRANPPDAIKNQRVETAAQEQRINTERQRKLAEDMRREAESSRAAADNAYRQSMSLSPDQFLQLESIKAMIQVCGGGKCSIVTAGALPTFGIK